MMLLKKTSFFIFLCILASTIMADTFKNKASGEIFTGFVTQKTAGNQTLVYNADESKMSPVVLNDFDVTYDTKGRRDSVSLLELTSPEVLLSDAISKKVAEAIIETSNKGPQAIIIQIDSPGGRGDYMKTIADAVLQTKNCPVIAYISGGTYGGAYSSAAIIALACEKVYINPTAGIGAVGSIVGSVNSGSYANYLSLYSSDTLLTYSSYVNSMAQHRHYPGLLLNAFIDKRVSIIEVANIDGSREYISKDDRQPTQTLIRTLCGGMSKPQNSDDIAPGDVVGKVLNLTAKDAVDIGLVNSTAESTAEILATMKMSEVKITPIPGIQDMVKKYTAAKRKIAQSLSRIDLYEKNIKSLDEQFTTVDRQLRMGTQTQQVSRGNDVVYSSRQSLPSNYNYYYDQNIPNSTQITGTNQQGRFPSPTSQTITTEVPSVNIQVIYAQLTASLRDLVREYRSLLNLVKRWPGGLPPELTAATLQENMNSASMELDSLYRYTPVYPTQPQIPQRPGRNRTP